MNNFDDIKELMESLWYRFYKSNVLKEFSDWLFQKKVANNLGTKYYLNFNLYLNKEYYDNSSALELDVNFARWDLISINLTLFTMKDINKENVLIYEKEVEEIFTKMWYDYYELDS